jgi:LmbE family N-acetylglucosaminyl deacetylase
VIAAHPDDEVLGIGGTIARHADAGDEVHPVIMAQGALSRATGTECEVERLKTAATRAAQILGAQPPHFGGFPDQQLDRVALLDLVKFVETIAAEVQPDIVYTHHGGDINLDHQKVHGATCTAFRALPGSRVRAVYTFETVSSTEWGSREQNAPFVPRHYVDITTTFERKKQALAEYAMEMRAFPHPRSMEVVECLARVRGSEAGVHAAEAFGLQRSTWI